MGQWIVEIFLVGYNPPMNDELTLREAGEVLGVTGKRVQAMIRQGQLTARMVGTPAGRYQVVERAEVEALREAREARASGERPQGTPGPAPRGVGRTPAT